MPDFVSLDCLLQGLALVSGMVNATVCCELCDLLDKRGAFFRVHTHWGVYVVHVVYMW